jgi:hypothetical protein
MSTNRIAKAKWSVYLLDSNQLTWKMMNSYRQRTDAEQYARILRNSTNRQTSIVFEAANENNSSDIQTDTESQKLQLRTSGANGYGRGRRGSKGSSKQSDECN